MFLRKGPRVELFTQCLKALVEEESGLLLEANDGYKITSSSTLVDKRHYFAAGLISGGFV